MNMKKIGVMEGLKDNTGVYARIQGLNRKGREKCDFPTEICAAFKKKKNVIELPLNQNIHRAIQHGRTERVVGYWKKKH